MSFILNTFAHNHDVNGKKKNAANQETHSKEDNNNHEVSHL